MPAQRIFSRKKWVGVAWKVFKSKESQHGVGVVAKREVWEKEERRGFRG